MKIAVVGIGYVGLANAIFFSQYNEVYAIDINPDKIQNINNKNYLIQDYLLPLINHPLNLHATLNKNEAYQNAEYVIVATPTDYNPQLNNLDTKSIESVVKDIITINPHAIIIIRSTIPLGYTDYLRKFFNTENIIFIPEFLRESYELYDCLYPSRLIIGEKSERAKKIAALFNDCTKKTDTPILYTESSEAEAIKLFSNSYLAMRVAYFNELDSLASQHKFNAKDVIEGVCLDPRIGSEYNNPSFGYGGYCLIKDTQQILSHFFNTPQNLMKAIIDSNQTRIDFVVDEIIRLNPGKIGVYRLIMKKNATNLRFSSTVEVIQRLKEKGKEVFIYEPILKQHEEYCGMPIIHDLEIFKETSDLILANRVGIDLSDVHHKIYSRDIFHRD